MVPMTRRISSLLILSLAVTGCVTAGPGGPVETFELSWEAHFTAEGTPIAAIEAGLRFTNRSGHSVAIRIPTPCAAVIRAYQLPASASPRVWDQGLWDDKCDAGLRSVVLEPGQDHLALSGPVPVAAILGDSLPSGQYEIVVTTFSDDLPNDQAGLTAATQLTLTRQ
jgi:hypothetical protein